MTRAAASERTYYCHTCGTAMESRVVVAEFCRLTGEPIKRTEWRCPRSRSWNPFDRHDGWQAVWDPRQAYPDDDPQKKTL